MLLELKILLFALLSGFRSALPLYARAALLLWKGIRPLVWVDFPLESLFQTPYR
jgi:hypothetical protein